ncbi:MAG: DUF169 domain-containing protein [Thermogutta sp.]|nr:DUF169 domain-containing protein [Thermogutta sp.]
MESRIASAIRLELAPVALIWADRKPEPALEFARSKWGCVMFLMAAAAKGRTAVAGRETFGCWGGGVGLGFGNQYKNFPGGEECFCCFLSHGIERSEQGDATGEEVGASVNKGIAEGLRRGERYIKTPELAAKFIQAMPMVDIPARYVVMKPLGEVDRSRDDVKSITFFVNPDQLSALVVLANYDSQHNENVIIPYAAGCQVIGIFTYRELGRESPRALVGLTDISARRNVRRQLGKDVLSFSVTPEMFDRMEGNVSGSFLEEDTWKGLADESCRSTGR